MAKQTQKNKPKTSLKEDVMRFKAIQIATMFAILSFFSNCNEEFGDYSAEKFSLESGAKYVVVLKPHADARNVARGHGLTPTHVYSHVFKGFSANIPEEAMNGLSHNPHVHFIAVDREVEAFAQTNPTGILRMGAITNTTANIDGVDDRVNVNVAVIDTGIDLDHPDLNVVGGVNCNAKSRNYNDENGHGTHVAGTIGALDNDIGVVGIAPGANLYAVRVLDRKGSGYMSDVICGIDWVAANADIINVANMSLGGSGSDDGNCGYTNNDPEHQAICAAVNAGVTIIVAAGNESDNSANHTPAAYDEVITVSALADFDGLPGGDGSPTCRNDEDDTLANFSNFGSDIDIMAPGVCIMSTWKNGGYDTISGTSMAAPHIAGAAALILAVNPGLTPDQLRTELLTNVDTAPCNSSDGNCTDDPDGIQEPLSFVGTQADPVCGDGICYGEDCSTCSDDCGACPYCGDAECNGTEDCNSCETDCGACPVCGDGVCNGSEDCESCADDCGACPIGGAMCAPCSGGSDCESGLCLDDGAQTYCTLSCNIKENNCPDGSTCIRIRKHTVCAADSGCPL